MSIKQQTMKASQVLSPKLQRRDNIPSRDVDCYGANNSMMHRNKFA